MQVRDLIAELQRFDPRDEVIVDAQLNPKPDSFGVGDEDIRLEPDRVVRECGQTLIKAVE